jgi:glucose/arabinose dehydrogenase
MTSDRNWKQPAGHFSTLTKVDAAWRSPERSSEATAVDEMSSSVTTLGARSGNPRPMIATAYAKYIGRVGALAVALGVSGAVATTPGVAWADEAPSSTSSSSPAPESNDTQPSSPSAADHTATSITSGSAPAAIDPAPTNSRDTTGDLGGGTEEASGPGVTSETVTISEGGVIVRSSGGARTADVADDGAATDAGEPTDGTGEEPIVVEPGVEQPTAGDELEPSTEQPTSGENVEQPTADEDNTPQTPPDTPATTHPLENVSNAEQVTQQLATDALGPSTDTSASSLQSHSSADATATRLLIATDEQPSAAATQTAATFAALPTPASVVHDIKAVVTRCVCGFINQAISLINGLSGLMAGGAAGPGGPAEPAESPMGWAVLGWVRRQFDQAVEAFGRTPVAHFFHQVTTQFTQAVTDFGNSPTGRQISSQVFQALQQCQPSTALPAEFDRATVVAGLNEPTDFAFLVDAGDPDQIHRILITEKAGAVKVYDPHTGTLTTLVDLSTVTADGERGLVGIEVDPQFWTHGAPGYHTIYVAYTGADNYDRLSRMTLSESLGAVVNETELLKSTELGNNFHHGGEIQFDPQGRYLYWAVGDNTDSANAQDLTNIHGKILRLNRDGTAPDDNPFVNVPNAVDQIYAYGFRNPYRFTFTPNGKLLVGDVGEATWEELNVVTRGGNYGWPDEEGACSGCSYVNPIYAYRHSLPPVNAGAITSVVVYTGTTFPASYQNKVFIADYSIGWIKELTFDSEFSSLISERTFDSQAGTTVKLTQGPDGNLYQLTIYPGRLSVIAPSEGNRAPSAVITATPSNGAGSSLQVQLSSASSSDPDGDALTYHWDFGDGGTSTEANPTRVYTTAGPYSTYTVTLTVSDGEKTSVATQQITVGSTPPTAAVTVNKTTYNAGDTIVFTGTSSDAQDGTDLSYNWTVVFHHADHVHPFRDNIIGPTGSITIPRTADQLYNTFYRITLTVTDKSGLSTTQSVDVKPNLVALTFDASNPAATYTIDGVRHKGRYTEQAVVGVERVLDAPSPQSVSGGQLVFGGWSDGGAQSHTIITPATDTSYVVTYDLIPSPTAITSLA